MKIKNLDFSFDEKKVFRNLNLEFKKGKFMELLDQVAQKTTLANLILGLLDQKNGEILINDKYKLDEIKNSFQFYLKKYSC